MHINNKPYVSIGIPVHNGEKFLRNRLDSILNQSYTNFELIIFDNNSNDSTQDISYEYIQKDKRIKYFCQKKHVDVIINFYDVLQAAKYDYFVWAAVDDLWKSTFLEKNIIYLENNEDYVCSISQVEKYGKNTDIFKVSKKDSLIKKRYKKMRKYFRPFEIFSIKGDYNQKIKQFLENPSALIIYGVYRTNSLKKSIIVKKILAFDFIIILNVLEFGNINVLNETLFKYYNKGMSSNGLINQFKKGQIPLSDVIFPYYNFFNYSFKKFGLSFIISNFQRFFTFYTGGIVSNIKEIFMTIKLNK